MLEMAEEEHKQKGVFVIVDIGELLVLVGVFAIVDIGELLVLVGVFVIVDIGELLMVAPLLLYI
jgi:transcriptional regulatory protein LevR